MTKPTELYHMPIPPHMTHTAHYAHFETEACAKAWAEANLSIWERISQAPRGDWVVKWISKETRE